MVFVLVPFTAAVVLANQISNGQSQRERKFRYVLEEFQIVTIWLVKACLLVLYWRILYAHLVSFSSSLTSVQSNGNKCMEEKDTKGPICILLHFVPHCSNLTDRLVSAYESALGSNSIQLCVTISNTPAPFPLLTNLTSTMRNLPQPYCGNSHL
jgi:hypothetical protein